MCPASISTLTSAAVGATSTGGLAALLARMLRVTRGAKNWPIGTCPLLRDEAKAPPIPESSMIIEYLARHYPGKTALVPEDADLAWETRLCDRFYDLYVNVPMQKIVTDRVRPAGRNDPHGVEEARNLLRTAYRLIDQEMETRTWAIGDAFSMADCAAAPAMYYANLVMPFRRSEERRVGKEGGSRRGRSCA